MLNKNYPVNHNRIFIRKQIMTEKEREFFKKLKVGLAGLCVFPQVSMNAILDIENQTGWWDRDDFWFNILDFVICTPKHHNIIAVCELDGPTHDNERQKKKDQKRDDMLRAAGIVVVRYDYRDENSEKKLNQDFKNIIKKVEQMRFEERALKLLADVTP